MIKTLKKKEKYLTIIFFIIALIFAFMFYQQITANNKNQFTDTGNAICTIDGKPVLRLFSTTSCTHCIWVGQTFDKIASEYAANGSVVAYHWQFDTNDNVLTPEKELIIPQSEINILQHFNPSGSVPTFVLGCKYMRIGNSFETQNNITAEEAYLRETIGKLL